MQENVGPNNMYENVNAYHFSVPNQPVLPTHLSASWETANLEVIPNVEDTRQWNKQPMTGFNAVSSTRHGSFGQAASYPFCSNVDTSVNTSSQLYALPNQTYFGIMPDSQPNIVPTNNLNAQASHYPGFLAEPLSTLGVHGEPYSGNLLTGHTVARSQVESLGPSVPIPPSFPFTFAFPSPQPFIINEVPHNQVQEITYQTDLQWVPDAWTGLPVEPVYPSSSSSVEIPISMGGQYHVPLTGTLDHFSAFAMDQNIDGDLTL